MNVKKIYSISLVLIFLFSSFCFCATLATERIGFVDLDKLMSKSDKSMNIRAEIDSKKSDMDKLINNKQKEIDNLQSEYDLINSSISVLEVPSANVNTSTDTANVQAIDPDTAAANNKKIFDYKKRQQELTTNINTKREELQKIVDEKDKGIKELEDANRYNLIGDMYDAIAQVALENSCTIIVDKNALIYGDSISDLTDKVLEKLK